MDIKNMFKDALILFAITLVAGLLLGAVNEVTKEPIANAKENAKNEAYKEVLPLADTFSAVEINEEAKNSSIEETGYTYTDLDEVIEGYENGNLVGYVITVTSHEGYGGDIQFSIGISTEGVLNGISILSISETAGLGMNAEKIIVPQLQNIKLKDYPESSLTYTKSGSNSEYEIDAISGATITTKAVMNSLNFGIEYYNLALKEENR